jgi:hypothetical protein
MAAAKNEDRGISPPQRRKRHLCHGNPHPTAQSYHRRMNTLRLLFLLPFLALAARAGEIWPDAAALAAASYPQAAVREIDLGKGVTVTAKFEITQKGNGGLVVPGYGLRVYDAHRDGVTYQGYLLRCEWKDMNGDGYLDLAVSGVAQYWSNQTGRLELEKDVTTVLQYDPAKTSFDLVQTAPEIFAWPNRQTATGSLTSPEK